MTPCVWFYRRLTWSWTVTSCTSQNWQFAQDEKQRETESCAGWVNLFLQKDTQHRHCRHYSLIFLRLTHKPKQHFNGIPWKKNPGLNKWINECVCVCVYSRDTQQRTISENTYRCILYHLSFPLTPRCWQIHRKRLPSC